MLLLAKIKLSVTTDAPAVNGIEIPISLVKWTIGVEQKRPNFKCGLS